VVGSGRAWLSPDASRAAARRGWDAYAAEYQAEHGGFLGDVRLVWCPEGLDEAAAGLLGDVVGRDVLEVGCGAAQGSRWLSTQGARAVGVDLSREQLRHAARLDAATGTPVPVVQADAERLPFAAASFDVAFAAFGAVQFVADLDALTREVARVLRPGGRWVVSVTHPLRWCFVDDPGEAGLVAQLSYWDRRPYVETDHDGQPDYVEHHRTLGDYVAALVGAGFVLQRLDEPEWPDGADREWGGWSATRGAVLPGTLIVSAVRG
jgi:SAM-dependent methyltransferase